MAPQKLAASTPRSSSLCDSSPAHLEQTPTVSVAPQGSAGSKYLSRPLGPYVVVACFHVIALELPLPCVIAWIGTTSLRTTQRHLHPVQRTGLWIRAYLAAVPRSPMLVPPSPLSSNLSSRSSRRDSLLLSRLCGSTQPLSIASSLAQPTEQGLHLQCWYSSRQRDVRLRSHACSACRAVRAEQRCATRQSSLAAVAPL